MSGPGPSCRQCEENDTRHTTEFVEPVDHLVARYECSHGHEFVEVERTTDIGLRITFLLVKLGILAVLLWWLHTRAGAVAIPGVT